MRASETSESCRSLLFPLLPPTVYTLHISTCFFFHYILQLHPHVPQCYLGDAIGNGSRFSHGWFLLATTRLRRQISFGLLTEGSSRSTSFGRDRMQSLSILSTRTRVPYFCRFLVPPRLVSSRLGSSPLAVFFLASNARRILWLVANRLIRQG